MRVRRLRDGVEEERGRSRQAGQGHLREEQCDSAGEPEVEHSPRRAALDVEEEREEHERRHVEEVALERPVRLAGRDQRGLCEKEDGYDDGDDRERPLRRRAWTHERVAEPE